MIRLIPAVAAFLLVGCLAEAAEFEVASLKQIQLPGVAANGQDLSFVGNNGVPFKVAGNRVTLTGTLKRFIAAAYGVRDYQIKGVPSWADSVRFNLTAKSPGEAVPATGEVRSMLQALLADRFEFKFHRESKEVPVFELSVVKTTDAFKPAGEDETFSWKLTQDKDKNTHSQATRESMADFVELVGASTDRPVVNKTGITGYIDYDIIFSPEGTEDRTGVDIRILDAVKKQLGMKLEPAKDKIDFLMIDSIRRPSEN